MSYRTMQQALCLGHYMNILTCSDKSPCKTVSLSPSHSCGNGGSEGMNDLRKARHTAGKGDK